MERGGSEAYIGAERGARGCGIRLIPRAMAPVVAGARAPILSELIEREVGGDLGGALLAAAAACEREGDEERATRR